MKTCNDIWIYGYSDILYTTTVIRFYLTLSFRMLSAFRWKKIINEVENVFVLGIFLTFYQKCSKFSSRHYINFMRYLRIVIFFCQFLLNLTLAKKIYNRWNDWLIKTIPILILWKDNWLQGLFGFYFEASIDSSPDYLWLDTCRRKARVSIKD